MKRHVIVLALIGALLLGVMSPSVAVPASAASHARSHPALFDKTRFLAHAGLAYFAFHHFVYKRWKEGGFKAGASHRTTNIIKAGIALLFTYHELKKAYDIAKSCHSKILCTLSKPLSALITKANAVANQLRGGQFSTSQVQDLTNSANSFSEQATKGGISIKDIPVFPAGA